MNNEMPKNIRQIGNVSDSTKVYLEDYVDTYIKQLKNRDDDDAVGIFLLGKIQKHEGDESYLVSGAILMKHIKKEKGGIVLGKETWKKACEDSKTYFDGLSIIGWAMVSDMSQGGLSPQVNRTHDKLFQKRKSLFIKIDRNDDHETIYTYRYNSLMELQGNYIYYEKNPSMQEYMIANRKENHLPPSEAFEDRAAQNFRSVIKEKQPKQPRSKRRDIGIVAGLVGVAALAVVVHSRYDALQELGESVLSLDQEDTLEASSEVTTTEPTTGNLEVTEKVESPIESDVIIEHLSTESQEQEALSEEMQTQVGNTSTGDYVEFRDQDTSGEDTDADQEGVVRYIVMEGDTLGTICKQHYGTTAKLDEIYDYNNIEEGEFLQIGQVIKLP